MPLANTPFMEGGYYRDRRQGYTVIELYDNGMKVTYDDGRTETFNLESVRIKARIYNSIISEYRRYHPANTDEYFETLGFLSAHGRFEAELPIWKLHQEVDRRRM